MKMKQWRSVGGQGARALNLPAPDHENGANPKVLGCEL